MAQCWRVGPTTALSQAFSVDIRAQDLVAFVSTAEPPAGYNPQGVSACHAQIAPGTVSLGVYFMAMEADGLTVDGNVMYSLDVDLVGPYPPTDVTAGIGQNIIVVGWNPATDSSIQGFNIYCQDQGATSADSGLGAPDATLVCPPAVSTTTDAASGGATDASSSIDMDACVYVNQSGTSVVGGASCVSDVLVDSYCLVNGVLVSPDSCLSATASSVDVGEAGVVTGVADAETEASVVAGSAVGVSNIPSMYLCGQVAGNTTNRFIVKSLSEGGPPQDGTQYAVAVAAYDGTGNIGIVGNLACVVPEPVMTFWDLYVMAGGHAGGGFCALEGAGLPVGGSIFGGGMGLTALTYARRRRRRR